MLKKYLLQLIDAKISLPTFLWVFSSVAIAVYILLNADLISLTPFGKHLILGVMPWASIIIVGDILCLIGMFVKSPRWPLVYVGSFASFCMWTFANISLIAIGGINIALAWTIPYLFTYAYLFLAAGLGFFKRE